MAADWQQSIAHGSGCLTPAPPRRLPAAGSATRLARASACCTLAAPDSISDREAPDASWQPASPTIRGRRRGVTLGQCSGAAGGLSEGEEREERCRFLRWLRRWRQRRKRRGKQRRRRRAAGRYICGYGKMDLAAAQPQQRGGSRTDRERWVAGLRHGRRCVPQPLLGHATTISLLTPSLHHY